MSTSSHPMVPGLHALHRRKLGRPRLAGDDAAIAALDEAVATRMKRLVTAARTLVREADQADIAQDVMLRLVSSPEGIVNAITPHLGPEGLDGVPSSEALRIAERIASSYVTTMLRNLAIERARLRGHAASNPMAVSDVLAALEELADPSDLDDAYDTTQRLTLADRSRRRLDDLAGELGARSGRNFLAAYEQLWSLSDELTTVAELVEATGVSEAALHQRHSRVRKDLLVGIEAARARGALDAAASVVLVDIVTVYLRRRQIRETSGVSDVKTLSKDAPR